MELIKTRIFNKNTEGEKFDRHREGIQYVSYSKAHWFQQSRPLKSDKELCIDSFDSETIAYANIHEHAVGSYSASTSSRNHSDGIAILRN